MRKSRKKIYKALDFILEDIIKDAIKGFFVFIAKSIFNLYGAAILLLLSSLLLVLVSWLRIPITMPAYLIGIIIVAIPIIVLTLQYVFRRYKSRQREKLIRGFFWRLDKNNVFIGPLCSKCKSDVIETYDQNKNAAAVFRGEEPEYVFTCEYCDNQIKKSIPKSEIVRLAIIDYQAQMMSQEKIIEDKDK